MAYVEVTNALLDVDWFDNLLERTDLTLTNKREANYDTFYFDVTGKNIPDTDKQVEITFHNVTEKGSKEREYVYEAKILNDG